MRPLADLAGRRGLVTGASSGIGEAVADALAGAGVRLALSGRDATRLDGVARRCSAVAIPADLAEPTGAARVVAVATEALGGLDIVIANAGAGWAGPLVEMDPAELDALVALNVGATLRLVRAALPPMVDARRGAIVIVGSIAGLLGVPGEAVYSATKAALVGFAEALRAEVAPAGVTVSLVSPGVVDTDFFVSRNRPYERRRPRPIPATRVADAVLSAITSGRPSVVVPRWLSIAVRLKGAFPGPYRALADRFG